MVRPAVQLEVDGVVAGLAAVGVEVDGLPGHSQEGDRVVLLVRLDELQDVGEGELRLRVTPWGRVVVPPLGGVEDRRGGEERAGGHSHRPGRWGVQAFGAVC